MKLLKGHTFNGPDGQGYRLTRDVQSGDTVLATDFEPIGDAPIPEAGVELPKWLSDQMADEVERQRSN